MEPCVLSLIPKQVEHLQNRKCWGWVYFFCLYIGSPGDGGTCSQEFSGPGESHVFFFLFFFAFCRYMKHLEILQDKNIDIQEMAK